MTVVLEQEDRDAVAINPGMLRDEFVAFPGVLSDYGDRYAEAISEAAAKSEQLEDVEAEVYLELRAEGGHTEATIKAKIRRDTRVRMARELWLAAEARKSRMRHKVMDPLYAKKEMLISIGAHQRAELNGDPMVKYAKGGSIDDLERKAFNER
jgi:hypothetical protein